MQIMSKTLKIKTLTPVHIGNGKKLSYFDYMIYGNYYYRINTDKCFEWIFENIDGSKDKIDNWISNVNYTLQESQGQGGNTLSVFCFMSFLKRTDIKSKLEKEIINNPEYYQYKMPCHKNISQELSEIIKTADNQLYIPGSSIKGMLRTILMNNAIFEEKDKNWIKDEIKNGGRNQKFFGEKIEKQLFRFGKNLNDAKYDIMRFLHITDTNTLPVEETGRIAFTGMYHNNGKMGEAPPPFEAIKEDVEFEARITIDVAGLKAVAKNKDKMLWINFEERLKKIFGIDIDFLRKNSNQIIEQKATDFILDSVVTFSAAIIYKEEYWSEKNNSVKLFNKYEDFPENAVKLGWASGFPAVTVFDALTFEDDNKNITKEPYVKALKAMKIMQTNSLDEFPITHRFENYNSNTINPIGWAALDFEDNDK